MKPKSALKFPFMSKCAQTVHIKIGRWDFRILGRI